MSLRDPSPAELVSCIAEPPPGSSSGLLDRLGVVDQKVVAKYFRWLTFAAVDTSNNRLAARRQSATGRTAPPTTSRPRSPNESRGPASGPSRLRISRLAMAMRCQRYCSELVLEVNRRQCPASVGFVQRSAWV